MKNGLNEEEVWPNELPGLWSSRDHEGERRESRRAFEEEGAAAIAQSVPVFTPLAPAPMAQTAPGRSLAALVRCAKRRRGSRVCVDRSKGQQQYK